MGKIERNVNIPETHQYENRPVLRSPFIKSDWDLLPAVMHKIFLACCIEMPKMDEKREKESSVSLQRRQLSAGRILPEKLAQAYFSSEF